MQMMPIGLEMAVYSHMFLHGMFDTTLLDECTSTTKDQQ